MTLLLGGSVHVTLTVRASRVVLVVKNPSANAALETQVRSLDWEDPLEKAMKPTPVFLPGESNGQRNLVGCSPWDRTELNMTEMT